MLFCLQSCKVFVQCHPVALLLSGQVIIKSNSMLPELRCITQKAMFASLCVKFDGDI